MRKVGASSCWFRRTITMALLASLAMLPVPALADEIDQGLTVRRWATAYWMVPADRQAPHGADAWSYRVWVRRVTTPSGETITRVDLSRYACQKGRVTVCRPLVQLDKVIPNEAFQFDDTLGSASVRFRARGSTHRVAWEGVSQTGRAVIEGECGESAVGDKGQGLNRYAKAEGQVLGRRMVGKDTLSLTSMQIMAYVKTC